MTEGGELGGKVYGVHTSIILEMSYLSIALAGRRELPRIHHGILHLAPLDRLLIPNERAFDRGVLYLGPTAENAVGDGAAENRAARFNRDIGADGRVLQRDAVLDIDGILDLHVRRNFGRTPSSTMLEQMLVGLEQRVDLPTIVPPADFADIELLPLIDHVLECVGEVELPTLPRGTLHHVIDAVEQRAPILDVL